MSASAEFIDLCKSQVALLTKGLGASLSVVYLTEERVEGRLVPVVAYPDTALFWEEGSERGALQLAAESEPTAVRSLEAAVGDDRPPEPVSPDDRPSISPAVAPPGAISGDRPATDPWIEALPYEIDPDLDGNLAQPRQIVLPLIHESAVMGLLVTTRDDRPWNDRERSQIERIAQTMAIACILDRRQRWLGQQLDSLQTHTRERQHLHDEQHDLFDSLLHQIRSPLTAVKTFGKLLLKRLLPEDPNRTIAENLLRESDRVRELLEQMDRVNDWADESDNGDRPRDRAAAVPRLTASPELLLPPSRLEICDVPTILNPLLASAEAIAGDRGLHLQARLAPQLPKIRAYPSALREVLTNLIDNALKYTPAGGHIEIASFSTRDRADRPEVAIAISDTGPGIPPEDLENLFQRHYRGVQAQGNIPGTGLGLAIARDLIRDLQGDIEVYSPAEPDWIACPDPAFTHKTTPGTTFVVKLPALDGDDLYD
ncbi:HAMP domain-containing histidine kinase [Oxynema sp. CENA135]|uniref:sensor histidine kinase n=1 Tax=Oxynema sp. CENA135 TaxID=984206 RepID=UPI00190C10DD|nr:HAMP domain-containing sensor histidine kinase [Oxynema sp. CENA135]MBK4731429.1 HAMP domain-containing histidine kinase [Oxynema sp. CENA135]